MNETFIKKVKELKKKNAHLSAIVFDKKENALKYFFFIKNKSEILKLKEEDIVSISNLFPCAEIFELELKERFNLKFPFAEKELWYGD